MLSNYDITPKIVYGDTDSIFINLQMQPLSGAKTIPRREVIEICIEIGKVIEHMIKKNYSK